MRERASDEELEVGPESDHSLFSADEDRDAVLAELDAVRAESARPADPQWLAGIRRTCEDASRAGRVTYPAPLAVDDMLRLVLHGDAVEGLPPARVRLELEAERRKVEVLRGSLFRISSAAGMPCPADACRAVLAVARAALEATE